MVSGKELALPGVRDSVGGPENTASALAFVAKHGILSDLPARPGRLSAVCRRQLKSLVVAAGGDAS